MIIKQALNENDFLWAYSHRHFTGFKLLYRSSVISVNKFLKIENQESLHADPWLGKRLNKNLKPKS